MKIQLPSLSEKIKITKYKKKYADDTIAMWRESKEKAIGQKDAHSFLEHKNYFDKVVGEKKYDVYIALAGKKIIGMIAFTVSEVNQLYIHNDHQGKGLGKKLLDMAKNKSSGTLVLFTFEVNQKAQKFYERNGFKKIGESAINQENLNAFKYEWVKEN